MKEFDLETYGFYQTHSGERITYPDIKPEQIKINDIANSHAFMCRYNGGCEDFFSVGSHCLVGVDIVSYLAKNAKAEYSETLGNPEFTKELKKAILMHDAAEYVCLDFPRPLKAYFNTLGFGQMHQDLEDIIFSVIAKKYGIRQDETMKSWVDTVDDIAGIAESEVLYSVKHKGGWLRGGVEEEIKDYVRAMIMAPMKDVKQLFMITAEELGIHD